MNEKKKLRRLRDKHSRLYFEWLILGAEIRDLAARVREMKPQNRVDREVRENWNLTVQILQKVGFISTTKWKDISRIDKPAILSFHRIRRDLRKAIAIAIGIKRQGRV